MNDMALETETAAYERDKEDLLAHHTGKYVVYWNDRRLGTFEAYADALQAGYQEAGVEPFLVKKVSSEENLAFFTRDVVAPCRASV